MARLNDPVSTSIVLRSIPRAFDDLPLWAQLNITHRCNLDCAYCTEYDNSKDHVPFEELARRIDHCQELGCLHVDLIGGEPLLHPDVARLMRYVTQQGMTTGMTTNAFLLTRERLEELIDAGMGKIQISVDALNPSRQAPKSLKTLAPKIEMVARYPIWFRVNTVLCDETLDEVEEVARFCFDRGVTINFSVVHERGRLVKRNAGRFLEKVRWLKEQKRLGKPVATPYYLIHYFEEALQGRTIDWTCEGGNKCFYVSPEGHFHYCYHIPSERRFLHVTREELSGYRTKKGCEKECGVDCVVETSMPYGNRALTLYTEARERLVGLGRRLSGAVAGRQEGQRP
jgi:MoaA/NifB/PqqE/SkfB family radical SAM enzyme